MKKANVGFYIQKINDIVTDSEKVGETMHPSYESIRQAIDNGTLGELTEESLSETQTLFSNGTEKYRTMKQELDALKAPVKVIGVHKKLQKAFENYVDGCQEMVESIVPAEANVNVDAFNDSEAKQDSATDEISFCIQRITQLVMGR